MLNINENFRDYIFATPSEHELTTLYHKSYQSDFSKTIEKILDEYGLSSQIRAASQDGRQALALDVGCAEGLYLHTLADILEKRSLLKAAGLIGIDLNATFISNAERLGKESQPPRPYLQFYLHDATQPLENCPSLKLQNKLEFDLIYALRFASFIPNSRQTIEQLYKALKPGGVIYLYDVTAIPGEEGWIPPPPMIPLVTALFANFASLNGGANVAAETSKWLEEAGAEMIQTGVKRHVAGNGTQEAIQFLRFWVMTFHTAGPMLVKRGFLTAAQFEEAMSKTYRELNANSQGQLTFGYTLARKPL